jgi:hypothetical protein
MSNLCLIYLLYSIFDIWCRCSLSKIFCSPSRGAPAWLYICNRARFYKGSSRIQIRTFLLRQQVIFESLCRSTSLMGRTRYTNSRVPEGHIHVSSPRDSIRVADSGWVSKLQIFDFFNSLISSIFDFFNLWLLQFSTSILWLPEIFGFLNLLFRWEWNVEFIFWCLPPIMDSKFSSSLFIDDLLEVNLHRVHNQRSRWE